MKNKNKNQEINFWYFGKPDLHDIIYYLILTFLFYQLNKILDLGLAWSNSLCVSLIITFFVFYVIDIFWKMVNYLRLEKLKSSKYKYLK